MLHDLVLENVDKYSDRDCIVYDDGSEMPKNTSYSQLCHQVTELKAAFGSLGIEDNIVVVLLKDCIEVPSVLIGLLSSSCAFYPINLEGPQYTVKALVRVGASWIVAHEEFAQKILPVTDALKCEEVFSCVLSKYSLQLWKLKCTTTESTCSSVLTQKLAYCITTSGTTSTPKVVRVPHSCIVPNVRHLRQIFQLGVGDKVLLTSPLTFDPSIIDIFCTLSSGACLVIVPAHLKRRPDRLLNVIYERQAITFMQATPTLMKSLTPARLQQTLLGSSSPLRVLALGGEKFPPALEMQSWLHPDNNVTQFYNLYGITEVSCWASCQWVDIRNYIASNEPVPVGAALEKTLIRLMPCEEGYESRTVTADEGYIWIGSAERICFVDDETHELIFRSQENDNVAKEEKERIVWRNTGDRGRVLPDGNIVCLGRDDEQVKRHGKRLNLNAVETVCQEIPGVSDCCVMLDQNILIAFISLNSSRTTENKKPVYKVSIGEHERNRRGLKTIKADEKQREHTLTDDEEGEGFSLEEHTVSWEELKTALKQHLQESLPDHYMPDVFFKLDAGMPFTTHGKRDKKLLLKMAAAQMKASNVEQIQDPWLYAQDLWKTSYYSWSKSECLHLPEPPTVILDTDNFIFLGGDSLAAVRVINTLENTCGENLPQFFDLLINKDFGHFVQQLKHYIDLKRLHNHSSELSELDNRHINKIVNTDNMSVTDMMCKSEEAQTSLDAIPVRDSFIISNKGRKIDYIDGKHTPNTTTTSLPAKIPKLNETIPLLKSTMPQDIGEISSSTELSTGWHHSDKQPKKGSILSPNHMKKHTTHSTVLSSSCSHCGQTHQHQQNLNWKRIVSRGKTWHKVTTHIQASPEQYNSYSQEGTENLNFDKFGHNGRRASDEMISHIQNVSGESYSRTVEPSKDSDKFRGHEFEDSNTGFTAVNTEDANSSFVLSKTSQHHHSSAAALRLCWKFDTKKCVDASPLVVEYKDITLVFIGSHSGQFSAIDVFTGQEAWTVVLPDRIESSACASKCGSYVAVGCYDGAVYFLNVDDGSVQWKFMTGDAVKCSPILDVTTGFILCGSHDGFLYSLDIEKQGCCWKCRLAGGSVFSSPVIDTSKRVVYAASLAGKVSAFHTDSGQCLWTADLHKPLFSSLCLLDHSLLVGCVDGTLYCISASGHIEWTFKTQAPIFSTPTVDNNTSVIIGSHDHHVYCLNKDGELIWKYKTSSTVYSTAFISTFPHHDQKLQIYSHNSLIHQTYTSKTLPISDESENFESTCSVLSKQHKMQQLNTVDSSACHTNCSSILQRRDGSEKAASSSSRLFRQCKEQPVYSSNFLLHHPSHTTDQSNEYKSLSPTLFRQYEQQPNTNRPAVCSFNGPDTSQFTNEDSDAAIGQCDTSLCSGISREVVVPTHNVVKSHEMVVTASTDGHIYVMDLDNGHIMAQLKLEGEVFSSPIVIDNLLIVGCRDDFVYCFEFT